MFKFGQQATELVAGPAVEWGGLKCFKKAADCSSGLSAAKSDTAGEPNLRMLSGSSMKLAIKLFKVIAWQLGKQFQQKRSGVVIGRVFAKEFFEGRAGGCDFPIEQVGRSEPQASVGISRNKLPRFQQEFPFINGALQVAEKCEFLSRGGTAFEENFEV
jgi:hypothetical protein